MKRATRQSHIMNKQTANKIYKILDAEYGGATTALQYRGALQLMVATILAAQCTDKRVNIVTKDLFKKYKSVKDFARANQEEFQQEIHSTGFYKNKAKNIIAATRMIEEDFKGKVPRTMEDLIKLPGVARKTANIVLHHAFGKDEGIAVDTHVKRLSGLLGMTQNADPGKIEQDLMKLFDRDKWGKINTYLVEHGRAACVARRPMCDKCKLAKLCPSCKV